MQREAPFPLVHGFRLSARSSRTLLGSVEVSWGPQFLGSTVCLRKHPDKEFQGLKHRYEKNRGLPKLGRNSHLLPPVACPGRGRKDQRLFFGEEGAGKRLPIF